MSISIPISGNVTGTSPLPALDIPTADEVTVATAPELINWFTGHPHYYDPVSGRRWDRPGGRQHGAAAGYLAPTVLGNAMIFDGEHAIDVRPGSFLPLGAYTFYCVVRSQAVLLSTTQIWGCPNQATDNGAVLVLNTTGAFVWIHANPTWAIAAQNLVSAADRNYINERVLVRGSISASGTATIETNGVQRGTASGRVANTNGKIYIGDAPARNTGQPFKGALYDLLFFNGDLPVSNPTLATTTENMLAARNIITLG